MDLLTVDLGGRVRGRLPTGCVGLFFGARVDGTGSYHGERYLRDRFFGPTPVTSDSPPDTILRVILNM